MRVGPASRTVRRNADLASLAVENVRGRVGLVAADATLGLFGALGLLGR